MKFLLLPLLFLITQNSFADTFSAEIKNFTVKESLLKNNKIVIIATDSLETPREEISGNYTFTVSGFTQVLSFNDGMATLQLPIEKSTFVYLKHKNEENTISKLLYIYKDEISLKPVTVSRVYFVIIPLIIIFLIFAFKKLIYIGIAIFAIFSFFGYKNGLDISTYFASIFDYLKQLL